MVAYCNHFFGFKTRKRRYLLVQFVVGSRSYCERFFFNDSGFLPLPKTINSKSYFDYFPTLYHSYSSVIVSEYKALGNSAYLIIYRTESSHVRSCFRCTSLEKDETLLSTDFASESPKAR